MGQDHRRKFLKKVSSAKKQAAFAGDFMEEIKKIEWVTKRDLKRYVKLVLMSIFGFGFSIYCVDLVLRKSLSLLGKVTSFFFG
ncbi:preprotein translocase subunit SecE [Chlamydia trachomatis]|jgi:preprotein translocase, SecE subunit, bacterial|uniref:Protein translocase subunit SecE n=2 Tax=Chlamydia muridarum TaxID=83560 RepID=A0A069ZV44_CHLMR|nr:preprotein translocase subunit SecE [Chlamydia muridarum]UFT43071.1 preprotein translocase subunit SecE [Chlamydia trachomatis]AAF39427.1 preprotein translocase SecE subunit [Chlamydia muridarum str. Nigg]AHH22983.1 preprotein translocase subunit SecE [Chlamydia muridarum str. Nigg3 CMUT3-5]AHH23908.1 preprotein translocase subunit SecE [Chlamydia muridarum str. Nigg CM972]AID38115.1 preprotein translocase subunit SecE [Chlamydia muridarum str. Nigg 2 MCR]